MEIDVIIPVYKPDSRLFTLIEGLESQTLPVRRILLVNTERKYFQRLVQGSDFPEKHEKVAVLHISKAEFDHGGTRNLGASGAKGDVLVFMTQDAVPADRYLLERLTHPLKGRVAVAYARQLAAKDCGVAERFVRNFNYPARSEIKWAEDISRLGIKTFFCSNVCAAYRRDVFEELGGFVSPTIFNEDMIFAAKAIDAGYGVAYAAEAEVIHSHNYSGREQFARNFDLGVSQADHPEIFARVPSESEGKRMVGAVTRYLAQTGNGWRIPYFYFQTACKYAGYLLGKNYKRLPRGMAAGFAMNKAYFGK